MTEAVWNRDIVSAFEEQVARAGTAIALRMAGEELSYAELNRWANRLARQLRARGVVSEARVALCLDRGFEAVAGMLAILKAGASYVPIDVQYPLERIEFMLADSEATCTLIDARVPAAVAARLVRPFPIDPPAALDAYDGGNLGLEIEPSRPAYVMYTSGTTGRPKGAAIPQSGVCRLVNRATYIELGPTDVVLHHATPSFDATTFEVWAALLNGGRLAIYSRPVFDLEAVSAAVRDEGVTTLLLTTSVFHLVVEHRPECLASLRNVLVGGDVLQARAVKAAIARYPHLRIINGYGPTENTTLTCCFVATKDTAVGETVPIGRALGGTHVFILDEALQPVAAGETGELYTSGLGLASGYLNAPELTARHFLPNPFPDAGPLLYRTGDLVWRDPAGDIHFAGRVDSQVKIRGFRVEPGEIEHLLQVHEDVADAAVSVEDSGLAGDKQLCAYVTARPSRVPTAPALQEYLAARLPKYMVPAHVHVLAAFPLTTNGKIDRRKLREQVAAATVEDATEVGPGIARVVLQCWREQLRAPALSIDAPLYDHGASSLTVMIVHHELNERLGCSADPVELALLQTPRAWADVYDRYIVQTAPDRGAKEGSHAGSRPISVE